MYFLNGRVKLSGFVIKLRKDQFYFSNESSSESPERCLLLGANWRATNYYKLLRARIIIMLAYYQTHAVYINIHLDNYIYFI